MFNALKLYTIHAKQSSDATIDKPIFLREGFNFYAFILNIFWALYHRLWFLSAVIFAAQVALAVVVQQGVLSEQTVALIQLAVYFLVGAHANDCLRAKLQKQGFVFQDITSGDSLLRAQQRYFDRLTARAA